MTASASPENFYTLFESEVVPHLKTTDTFPQGVEALQAIMPRMATKRDRSSVYHWLGILHNALAAESLRAGDEQAAQGHFELTGEFLVKSLGEDSARATTRLALARYFLAPVNDPKSALECLDPVDDPDFRDDEYVDARMFTDHQRLTLRGAALALLGRDSEALDTLRDAYDARFHGLWKSGPDLTALYHLVVCGKSFPAEDVATLRERVTAFGTVDEDADRILESLVQQ